VLWVDDRVVAADAAVVRADDSAYREGRGCFSTVRISGGRPRFADRHIARLQRGVRELGLGRLDPVRAHAALEALAAAAFADGEGIVRLQASCDSSGLRLVGIPRPLGVDPAEWSATRSTLLHPGPSSVAGLKVSNRLTLSLAAEQARAAGVDEAILADAAGRLVEGTRSNLILVLADGTLATPPIESGAVAGIARQVCLDRIGELEQRMVPIGDLAGARELIAVNAVRGARPVTSVDDTAIAGGVPGPWSRRLADVLASD